jgi:hypothetical protein
VGTGTSDHHWSASRLNEIILTCCQRQTASAPSKPQTVGHAVLRRQAKQRRQAVQQQVVRLATALQ